MSSLPQYEESPSCTCKTCVSMCDRPCWPSPGEAKALIEKGYGGRLMLDYWVGGGPDNKDIQVLCPASRGRERQEAAFYSWDIRRCVFLTSRHLCELHDPGLKPIEGHIASCKDVPEKLHGDVAKLWNNKKGRGVVEDWKQKFMEGYHDNSGSPSADG